MNEIDNTNTTPQVEGAKNPPTTSLTRLHPLLTALEVQLLDARRACEALAETDMGDASHACTYLVPQFMSHVEAVRADSNAVCVGIRAATNAPEPLQ